MEFESYSNAPPTGWSEGNCLHEDEFEDWTYCLVRRVGFCSQRRSKLPTKVR